MKLRLGRAGMSESSSRRPKYEIFADDEGD
jgi:hypothetical protein